MINTEVFNKDLELQFVEETLGIKFAHRWELAEELMRIQREYKIVLCFVSDRIGDS